MMAMRRRSPLGLGWVALLVACTTEVAPLELAPAPPTDGGTPEDAGAIEDAGPRDAGTEESLAALAIFVRARCEYLARCDRPRIHAKYGGVEDCVADQSEGYGRILRARLLAGRTHLSQDGLMTCVVALSGACGDGNPERRCLDALVVGDLPTDVPCTGAHECGRGLSCLPQADGCARCQPPLPRGAPCPFPGASCGGELICSDRGSQTCQPPRVANLGEECVEGELCLGPTYCGVSEDATLRCTLMPGLGEACSYGGGPPPGAGCREGICRNWTCVPYTFVEPGESCNDERLCHGRCVDRECQPWRVANDPCVLDECRFDAFCDPAGRCQPRGEAGAACAGPEHCRSGLECWSGRCSAEFWLKCP